MENNQAKCNGFSNFVKKYSKNNLLEKFLLGFFCVILILLVLIIKEFKNISFGLIGSIMIYFKVFKFLIFLSVVDLCFMGYNRFFLCKKRSGLFITSYIFSVISVIMFLLKNIKLSNFIEELMYNTSKMVLNIGSSLFEIMSILKTYFFAFILMFIAIILLIIFVVKNKDSKEQNTEISDFFEKGKENVDKAIGTGVNFVEKNSKILKEKIQSQEVQNAIKTSKKTVKKNKKKIIFSICTVVVILIGFSAFKAIKYSLKPDAIVSMNNIKIKIDVKGKNGFGKAVATVVGYPNISSIKDFKKSNQIKSIVNNYDIKLDKDKGLKNGDTVTATLSLKDYSNSHLKLKIDKKEIKETITVQGLEEIINSIKDLDPNVRQRMEKKSKSDIVRNVSEKSKGLKIEKVKTYEKAISEDELAAENNNMFIVREVYKVSYEQEVFGLSDDKKYEKKETIFVYEFSNFKKKDSAVIFDCHMIKAFNLDKNDDGFLEDLENRYQIEGFKEEK